MGDTTSVRSRTPRKSEVEALFTDLASNKEFDGLTTPNAKDSRRYSGFRKVVINEENEEGGSDFSDDRTMTRGGRDSVSMKIQKPREENKFEDKLNDREGSQNSNWGLMALTIPFGLMVLFISALVYHHFQGDYCDSGIPEAEGVANCSTLSMTDGRQCKVCPKHAICKRTNIVACEEGYKLLKNEICFPIDGAPMEENIITSMIEMDEHFRFGEERLRTFKNWGSSEDNFITGTEFMAHYMPEDEELKWTYRETVEKVLKTISQAGQDCLCLRNRF